MRTREHPTPKADDLKITMISASRWRVADGRLTDRPAISLLGFVDLQNGRFQVTRFDSPDISAHEVLSSALAEFLGQPGGREYLHPERVAETLPVPETVSAGSLHPVV